MSAATISSDPTRQVTAGYLPYSDSVEHKQDNEDQIISQITAAMAGIAETMADRFRHAMRPVHAKSHGLLKAQLRVYDNLPEYLAQGLFARAENYPAIMRFSTTPGDILSDMISVPRGLGIKVLGVQGQMLPENEGANTQDFVLVNGKVFGAKNAAEFLEGQKTLGQHITDDPGIKQIVSEVARGTNAVLTAFNEPNPTLANIGYPKTQILAETYGSHAPIRFGDYFGKIIVTPYSANLKRLGEDKFHTHGHYSALKENIQDFFNTETAVWEIEVQLCTDLDKMPVEDAATPWPEDLSQYIPIGQIVATPQKTYSPARRVYVDDHLSFNPWHALEAHRPLGNIMRARRAAYAAARDQRAMNNAVTISEPKSIDELPD
jgi:catalase